MKKYLIAIIILLTVFVLLAIPAASAWDGVCSCIKDYIKDNAHDPKSIKYVECSPILAFDNGLYGQRVKYRGKNAFGGLVLNEQMFYIKGESYNAVVVTVSSMDDFTALAALGEIKIIASYNYDGTRN